MKAFPFRCLALAGRPIEAALRGLDQRAAELEMDRREKNHLLESLREGIPAPGMEWWVSYFYPQMASIFSYLSPQTVIWLDGADRVEAEAERFGRLAWERNERAKEERRLVAPVETLYFSEHDWRAALEPFSRVHGESLTVLAASERAAQSTLTVDSFLTSDIRHETVAQGKEPTLAPLADRLKSWHGERVFLVAPTRGDATRLGDLRRVDGRDLDYYLHVNPANPEKGMLLVFNPLAEPVAKTIDLPLYYTGLTDTATIREQEGAQKKFKLDREFSVRLPVEIPANGHSWFVVE